MSQLKTYASRPNRRPVQRGSDGRPATVAPVVVTTPAVNNTDVKVDTPVNTDAKVDIPVEIKEAKHITVRTTTPTDEWKCPICFDKDRSGVTK